MESGLKLRLRDHGITTDDLPRLARDAMLGERMLNNPCAITESDALRLYEAAW